MKKLSILICTLPLRIDSFKSLIDVLNSQIIKGGFENDVEVIALSDSKTLSVGKKRNVLKDLASGEYICFIDDDDSIADNYIESILDAIKSTPDVVTFKGNYYENGVKKANFYISTLKGNLNAEDYFYRLPNHLCPVKNEIAKKCDFTDKNFGEDSDYSKEINRYICNEFHINSYLYNYDFNSSLSQTAIGSEGSSAFKK